VPSNFALRAGNAMHRTVLKLTGNKVGTTMGGMQVLTLTTTGRKSGQQRSAMLNAALRQGETIVLVASRGGDDRHPDWYLNLRANPDVQVTFPGGEPRPMHARVATAEERAELWPQVTAAWKGYAKYQRKTDREIPLVLIEPVASDG
jgi:deazaflavin-dependent oxidoreductase (nitroreductase family)